jgi:hypothetical protein
MNEFWSRVLLLLVVAIAPWLAAGCSKDDDLDPKAAAETPSTFGVLEVEERHGDSNSLSGDEDQKPQEKVSDQPTPFNGSVDSSVDYRQLNSLLDQRKRLDDTVWAKEVLAQEYEEVIVDLWDELRAAKDKSDVLATFPFERISFGEEAEEQPLDSGVLFSTFSGNSIKLDHDDWKSLLGEFRDDGFKLAQSEWHHAKFYPEGDQPARSLVNMTLHIANAKLKKRFIIGGELEIEWMPRSSDTRPVVRTIDAKRLTATERQGSEAFRLAYKINGVAGDSQPPGRRLMPMLVQDLNGDGLSELILPQVNEVHWNRGGMKFEVAPLFKLPPTFPILSAVIADFTGDGQLDVVVAGPAPVALLYAGDSEGRFVSNPDVVADFGKKMTNPLVISAGDINQDGRVDLWIGQYATPYVAGQMPTPYYDANDGNPAYLLINMGQQKFMDVTEQAGLADKRFRRTYSGSLVDLDSDQDLDLLVCSDFAGLDVYLNDGNGHFQDVSDTFVDHRKSFGMSLTFGDYDSNGRTDFLMVGMGSTTARRLDQLNLERQDLPMHNRMRAAMGMGNRLFLASEGGFRQAPFNQQVSRTGWSWGSATFDLENDGDPDIYVANGHISHGSAKDYCTHFWRHDVYTGSSKPSATIGAFFGELSKLRLPTSWNGYEHNALLMNDGGKGFRNVAFLMGTAFEFDSRCVVGDDLNGDGRIDLVVYEANKVTVDPYNIHVLENRMDNDNHWIGVRLVGKAGGPSTLGATVILHTADGKQAATVVAGDSFSSQHATTVHFGLGKQQKVDAIEIKWTQGEYRLERPAVDRYHTVESAE